MIFGGAFCMFNTQGSPFFLVGGWRTLSKSAFRQVMITNFGAILHVASRCLEGSVWSWGYLKSLHNSERFGANYSQGFEQHVSE